MEAQGHLLGTCARVLVPPVTHPSLALPLQRAAASGRCLPRTRRHPQVFTSVTVLTFCSSR